MTGPRHRREQGDFRWHEVEVHPYKRDGNVTATFRDLSRQVLFDNSDLSCQVRFFDVEAGGHTTLERHQHTHAVIVLAGRGQCLVGNRVVDLARHDLVEVGPWEWHQFRAASDQRLGFVCIVNRDRDRPQLPTGADVERLARDPATAMFLGRNRQPPQ